MSTALTYAIKFVSDMDEAVRFHATHLGLTMRFQSPEWSEFETGQTTLALHKSSAEHPPAAGQEPIQSVLAKCPSHDRSCG